MSEPQGTLSNVPLVIIVHVHACACAGLARVNDAEALARRAAPHQRVPFALRNQLLRQEALDLFELVRVRLPRERGVGLCALPCTHPFPCRQNPTVLVLPYARCPPRLSLSQAGLPKSGGGGGGRKDTIPRVTHVRLLLVSGCCYSRGCRGSGSIRRWRGRLLLEWRRVDVQQQEAPQAIADNEGGERVPDAGCAAMTILPGAP